MPAPVKPAFSRSFGQEVWIWAPAIADIDAPTASEINAVTGFNLSCSVLGEQEGLTGTTEKVTLPRRNCEQETFEVNGPTSYSAGDLMVTHQPQAASGTDGKKAWESLDDYAEGFLVHVQGVDPNVEPSTGDFVSIYPAQLGKKTPMKTSTGADGVFGFQLSASITNTPSFLVPIAA